MQITNQDFGQVFEPAIERRRRWQREYYHRNREAWLKKVKEYYRKNKDECYQKNRERFNKNREESLQYHRDYYQKNKSKMREQDRQRYLKNKEERIKRGVRYKNLMRKDPTWRLSTVMSCAINRSVRQGKGGHWEDIVGYTLQDLMVHLEAQFRQGMSWDNHGVLGWHIDHIRPISSFGFEHSEDPEFKECWSLDNLQPLWYWENCSKNGRWDGANS